MARIFDFKKDGVIIEARGVGREIKLREPLAFRLFDTEFQDVLAEAERITPKEFAVLSTKPLILCSSENNQTYWGPFQSIDELLIFLVENKMGQDLTKYKLFFTGHGREERGRAG